MKVNRQILAEFRALIINKLCICIKFPDLPALVNTFFRPDLGSASPKGINVDPAAKQPSRYRTWDLHKVLVAKYITGSFELDLKEVS